MESSLLLTHMLWDHEPVKGTLIRRREDAMAGQAPSPSPIRWERVAGRPGEGKRFMESPSALAHALGPGTRNDTSHPPSLESFGGTSPCPFSRRMGTRDTESPR